MDAVNKSYVDNAVVNSQATNIDTAVGNSNISTNSSSFVNMTDMTITDTFSGGIVDCMFNYLTGGDDCGVTVQLLIDNVAIDTWQRDYDSYGAARQNECVIHWVGTLAPTSHNFNIQWKGTGGGGNPTSNGTVNKRWLVIRKEGL
jgi:hypothetical protein